ncbi:TolC family protein [Tenacibaculum piscium]|uniref:TolC family protein n=1 Tax=Tenacibaculum piscium TaxID=1458515 RepID=UPI001EFB526D|nr:TolC family protein [Tenacibaculum piscium]
MQIKISKTTIPLLLLVGFYPFMSFAQQLNPVLKELINKGLHKSHTANIYNLDAQKAKIDQKLAKSVFLPNVTFNGSFVHLNEPITFDNDTQNLLMGTQKLLIKEAIGIPFNSAIPSSIPIKNVPNLQDENLLKAAVDVDWVLFSGFQASNALKASKHKEASLTYLGIAEKDKIALKIIETYDQLALVYASKKVLSISEKYLNEQEHFVKKAIENGLATPISRKKIEVAQQQLASKKLAFNQNKTLLIAVLEQLTGEKISHLKLINPQLFPLTFNQNLLENNFKNTNDTPNEIRNEIKALKEAEKATLYKAKMEKNNFIPKIALKGHYEFLEDDLSLLDPKWYVGVGVKWNAFDGFKTTLNSKKALIENLKYKEQRKQAQEMIALSLVKATLDYESSVQNITISEKEIDLTNATYNMINTQYKNNLAPINDVLDALTDLEKANFKLQESYFKQRRAITNLLHAKGILTSFYN